MSDGILTDEMVQAACLAAVPYFPHGYEKARMRAAIESTGLVARIQELEAENADLRALLANGGSPTTAEMLAEFHAELGEEPGRSDGTLRATLHQEEHDEVIEALGECERAATPSELRVAREHLARELADLAYILHGTAHAFNLDVDVALREVHRAAMSKLVGPGLPIRRDDGKILKPPGFTPPDMTGAVLGEASSARRSE